MVKGLPTSSENSTIAGSRAYVKGKFLYAGAEKFFIKGVTYGTFAPRDDGSQFPPESRVEADFNMMARHGVNSVRTYTVPPRYLLDAASRHGLRVMAGLPWEQHITFLDAEERQRDIIARVREGVAACGQHPAILCFTIGNEIPAGIVRWYGPDKIEKFLKQLYGTVKAADPGCLVTYVNFPTTEYLDLDFLDFNCFNVYLETPEKLGAYVARLHNLSGDKPLVMAEIGLDSRRNGEAQQAGTLAWQVQTVFSGGCAGLFVFAWTDEWWRGGYDIEDWDFGLVDRDRNPKPALDSVSAALRQVPFAGGGTLPFFSVVVCTYNGAATIRDCLNGLVALDYPAYEVIVVNDGSTDETAAVAAEYPVQLISTANQGLSSARNTGLTRARGEIIAYIDDDAYPDPHWLRYLAWAYLHTGHAGMGGPNVAPAEDGPVARCVANAPGGPVHVLLSDGVAEHIPGCNMSFRRQALLEIGGFDPVFRAAGDDVDVCWRIQKTGRTIGFHPAALVWHHRRNSLRAYWKQQKGYGKAEALLEAKWPGKYNRMGHLTWAGRIYGNGFTLPIRYKKDRIFYGTWGTALFQSVYQPAEGFLNAIPLMPEWYLLSGLLTLIASLGFRWAPLLWLWPVVAVSVGMVVVQAVVSASKNISLRPAPAKALKYRALITVLHLVQPVARLYGRMGHGLTPWRKRGARPSPRFLFSFGSRVFTHWSEVWRPAEDWLSDIEKALAGQQARVRRGGDFDAWDLQAGSSLLATGRCLLAIEEHGAGKQLLRLRCRTRASRGGLLAMALLAALTVASAADGQWPISAFTGALTLVLAFKFALDAAGALNTLHAAFGRLAADEGAVVPGQPAVPEHLGSEEDEAERELERMEKKMQAAFRPHRLLKARVPVNVRGQQLHYRKPEHGKT